MSTIYIMNHNEQNLIYLVGEKGGEFVHSFYRKILKHERKIKELRQ